MVVKNIRQCKTLKEIDDYIIKDWNSSITFLRGRRFSSNQLKHVKYDEILQKALEIVKNNEMIDQTSLQDIVRFLEEVDSKQERMKQQSQVQNPFTKGMLKVKRFFGEKSEKRQEKLTDLKKFLSPAKTENLSDNENNVNRTTDIQSINNQDNTTNIVIDNPLDSNTLIDEMLSIEESIPIKIPESINEEFINKVENIQLKIEELAKKISESNQEQFAQLTQKVFKFQKEFEGKLGLQVMTFELKNQLNEIQMRISEVEKNENKEEFEEIEKELDKIEQSINENKHLFDEKLVKGFYLTKSKFLEFSEKRKLSALTVIIKNKLNDVGEKIGKIKEDIKNKVPKEKLNFTDVEENLKEVAENFRDKKTDDNEFMELKQKYSLLKKELEKLVSSVDVEEKKARQEKLYSIVFLINQKNDAYKNNKEEISKINKAIDGNNVEFKNILIKINEFNKTSIAGVEENLNGAKKILPSLEEEEIKRKGLINEKERIEKDIENLEEEAWKIALRGQEWVENIKTIEGKIEIEKNIDQQKLHQTSLEEAKNEVRILFGEAKKYQEIIEEKNESLKKYESVSSKPNASLIQVRQLIQEYTLELNNLNQQKDSLEKSAEVLNKKTGQIKESRLFYEKANEKLAVEIKDHMNEFDRIYKEIPQKDLSQELKNNKNQVDLIRNEYK